MEFPEKVKLARKKLKLSQMALAKEMNVSCASINRWENGGSQPHSLIMNVFFDYCKKHGIIFEIYFR